MRIYTAIHSTLIDVDVELIHRDKTVATLIQPGNALEQRSPTPGEKDYLFILIYYYFFFFIHFTILSLFYMP